MPGKDEGEGWDTEESAGEFSDDDVNDGDIWASDASDSSEDESRFKSEA